MKLDRQKRTSISLLMLCDMVPCGFFSMVQGPHRSAWSVAFFVIMMLNFLFIAEYQSKRRQPDTLIHLFPTPPETSKERS